MKAGLLRPIKVLKKVPVSADTNIMSEFSSSKLSPSERLDLTIEFVSEGNGGITVHRFWHDGNEGSQTKYDGEGESRYFAVPLPLKELKSKFTIPQDDEWRIGAQGINPSGYTLTVLVILDDEGIWIAELFDEVTLDIWGGEIPDFFTKAISRAEQDGSQWRVATITADSGQLAEAFAPVSLSPKIL